MPFEAVDEVPVDPARARVFEHGWQSWSPTTAYPADARSHRPVDPVMQTMCYRPGKPAPVTGFQGEGLLAVDPGDGSPPRVWSASDPLRVPSIRASYVDGKVVVSADGPVAASTEPLAAWADRWATTVGVGSLRQAPTTWCSWYHYFTKVTEADIVENIEAIHTLDLPVDVVQIDDGWQAAIGDWLTLSGRFRSLADVVERMRASGRRAGIWVAPFLAAASSAVARAHPGWFIGGPDNPVDAGHNWDTDLYGLDATHPGAAGYLRDVFGELRELGFDFYKTDFLYAGALDGPRHDGSDPLTAYQAGLRVIREAIGPDAYLLGCGAPILSTAGLVDAMRVSADIAPQYEPEGGDASRPSQVGATLSTVGRAFMHGRFWVNDPDCLVARPEIERREDWAAVVEKYGGLRSSSDRIADLDEWGLATTRRLLSSVPAAVPFASSPFPAS